jgi:nucleoside-diphosphate-sugar epimerase
LQSRYAVTKRIAEEIVAEAVSARGLRAVTLRPRAIFGEDDELLFPKLVDRSVTSKRRLAAPAFATQHASPRGGSRTRH